MQPKDARASIRVGRMTGAMVLGLMIWAIAGQTSAQCWPTGSSHGCGAPPPPPPPPKPGPDPHPMPTPPHMTARIDI